MTTTGAVPTGLGARLHPRLGLLLVVVMAGTVLIAGCNSDKKEAEAAVKQAAVLAESDKPADLDEADRLVGEALKKDPANPGIPPVVDRIKARRSGAVKSKAPPVASKAECQSACTNDEEVGCRETLGDDATPAELKAEAKKECDAHQDRDRCLVICTKVWSPENAACIKAAKSGEALDRCLKSKLRHTEVVTKAQCEAREKNASDLASCISRVAWGEKILTPEGFRAVQAE